MHFKPGSESSKSTSQMVMASDERNFRSSYYEKVGFRNVEEKKSLEILLKDRPLDCIKLKQFCLRFSVPGVYRNLLWKLLLNMSPVYLSNLHFVTVQRTEIYDSLTRALNILRIANSRTPKDKVFLLMWLLESGELKLNHSVNMRDKLCKGFITISKKLIDVFDNDVDAYWIARGFYPSLKTVHDCMPRMLESSKAILEREDRVLYKHLVEVGVIDGVELETSFYCFFADILREPSLLKIWDKIVGGSLKILTFVPAVIFTTLRRNLLNVTNKRLIYEELRSITEETSEVIANKAIELWQKHGSPLVLADAR